MNLDIDHRFGSDMGLNADQRLGSVMNIDHGLGGVKRFRIVFSSVDLLGYDNVLSGGFNLRCIQINSISNFDSTCRIISMTCDISFIFTRQNSLPDFLHIVLTLPAGNIYI